MKDAAAIILAAGAGRRFGSDKRQAVGPWQGPLLHHVLGLFRPCFADLAVVIAPNDRFGADSCSAFAAQALTNPEPERGMGRSLAVAMDWLIEGDFSGAVIGLADMPWVPKSAITAVTATLRQSEQAVATSYHGALGFPRGIPRHLFEELRHLDGDRGASARLDWSRAVIVAAAEDGVLRDVDHPEDIAGGE
jgi:molybdenum cofactor cytidylyltransferase